MELTIVMVKISFTIDKVYLAVILNNKKIEDSDNHRK